MTDWRDLSACLREDPELFFPVGHSGPAQAQMDVAKQVCAHCKVREACLSWALAAGEDHGVLGGLTELERRELRRPALVRAGR